nr:MFS transporter [Actinomycetota bacterium]
TATVFFQLSYQTIVPELVTDQGSWHAANTRLSLSESMAVLLGPAAGGLAIAWLTPPGALGLDGASYAVSVLTLSLLARRPRPRAHLGPAPEAGAGSLRRQVLDGWRYVRASPVLDAIMWTGAAYNLGSAMYEALIVVFAVRGLHLTPTQFGLAIGVGGVGFPVGSALAGPLTRRLGLGPSLMWAAIPSVAGLILSALAGGTAPEVYLAAGTFLVGVGQGCFAVSAMTLRQLAAAPAFRARATAVHRFASWGTLPIGALLAGLIGQAAGMRAAMLTAGALAALCAWPLLASPLRKVRTAAEATALA